MMQNEIFKLLDPFFYAVHKELFTSFKETGPPPPPPQPDTALRWLHTRTQKRFSNADKLKLTRLAADRWVVRDTREVAQFINYFNKSCFDRKTHAYSHYPQHRKRAPSMQTFDFKDMYTHLPHSDILAAHKFMINLLIGRWHRPGDPNAIVIVLDEGPTISYKATLTRAKKPLNKPKSLTIFLKDTIPLFKFILDHCYVTYNGSLHHQTSGIPQGLEPAVFIANLCCSYYEYLFILQLIGTETNPTEWQLLLDFKWTKRYIDDIISIGSPTFPLLKYKEQEYTSPVPVSTLRDIID